MIDEMTSERKKFIHDCFAAGAHYIGDELVDGEMVIAVGSDRAPLDGIPQEFDGMRVIQRKEGRPVAQ